MGNENLDTKNKLLQAAIDIFGLKGEVTTREITEAAGVNVAAINYYFGNKNNLLKEVEGYYANLLNTKQHEFLSSNLSPAEKLVKWAYNLTEFMFRFPALIELTVNLATLEKTYNPALIERVYLDKEVQDMIEDSIIKGTGCSDPQTVKHKYLQIFSGIVGLVIHHIISKTYFSKNSIASIDSDTELQVYIDKLISDILAK